MPVMISHDAFYVSHSVEPVDIPDPVLVDAFCPGWGGSLRLDTELGQSFGAPIDQATWNRSRRKWGGDGQGLHGGGGSRCSLVRAVWPQYGRWNTTVMTMRR